MRIYNSRARSHSYNNWGATGVYLYYLLLYSILGTQAPELPQCCLGRQRTRFWDAACESISSALSSYLWAAGAQRSPEPQACCRSPRTETSPDNPSAFEPSSPISAWIHPLSRPQISPTFPKQVYPTSCVYGDWICPNVICFLVWLTSHWLCCILNSRDPI